MMDLDDAQEGYCSNRVNEKAKKRGCFRPFDESARSGFKPEVAPSVQKGKGLRAKGKGKGLKGAKTVAKGKSVKKTNGNVNDNGEPNVFEIKSGSKLVSRRVTTFDRKIQTEESCFKSVLTETEDGGGDNDNDDEGNGTPELLACPICYESFGPKLVAFSGLCGHIC